VDAFVITRLVESLAQDRAVVLATVIDTSRSVPRHAGSKMLVFADGTTAGTIGGGEMESRVVAEALRCLDSGRPRLVDYQLVDPSRGDPGVCGGTVQLYLEPYMPTPTVFVIGAGHIGRAVADLAHWLGFRVVVYDDRAEVLTPETLATADVCVGGPISHALKDHPVTTETHIVVVTRNMGVDVAVLPELLATSARSIGVMGSHRRWAATRAALIDAGVASETLDRVRSPIGVELHAETPEEIAVSILAEVVALRRQAG